MKPFLSVKFQVVWIICVLALGGCSNSNDVAPTDSPSSLAAKIWTVTQFELLMGSQTKQILYKLGGKENLLGIADYKFNLKSDGTFAHWTKDTKGNLLQQKGTWVLADNNATLRLTYEDKTIEQFQIELLSESAFVIKREEDSSIKTDFTRDLFFMAGLLNIERPLDQKTIGVRLKMTL